MPDADQSPSSPVDNEHRPAWHAELPPWGKVFLQLGAFGLIALLFALQSREQSAQLRSFQEEAIRQGREDRTMFREELAAQRVELKGAVVEMRRALDAIDANHRLLMSKLPKE